MPNNIRNLKVKIAHLEEFLSRQAPHIMGNEAVNFAQEQFQHEGFEDMGIEKWPEVKRRTSSSNWYGHQYGATTPRPGKRKRKANSITNFSPAATQRKILTGPTGNLADSFYYQIRRRGVVISNRMPYAAKLQEGGEVSVYGRGRGRIPARKMIGKSRALERRIVNSLKPGIRKVLQS